MVITGLTRNQLNRKVPWVRIPPTPPIKAIYSTLNRLYLLVIICSLIALFIGIPSEAVALLFSFYMIILEVINQVNTSILSVGNGVLGVTNI